MGDPNEPHRTHARIGEGTMHLTDIRIDEIVKVDGLPS